MGSPYVVRHEEVLEVRHAPEVTWAELVDIGDYARTWKWVRDLRIDPEPLREGTSISFVAAAPIPYRISIQLTVEDVVEQELLRTRVAGDLVGVASISLSPAAGGTGTHAVIGWDVEMHQRAMRIAARTARPLLMFGHDWAVRAALASFRERLAARGDDKA